MKRIPGTILRTLDTKINDKKYLDKFIMKNYPTKGSLFFSLSRINVE